MTLHARAASSRFGFTLIEVSIVLVILGLLVGGILAGQSLVRASALRQVTAEFDQYQTALNAFKAKYAAVPGDMRNAVQYWGLAPGGGSSADGQNATCAGLLVPSTTMATCNGNGNGQISGVNDIATGWAQRAEVFRAWQHLSNAGLVGGSFTGIGLSYTGYPVSYVGGNVPASKMNQAGWTLSSSVTLYDCHIASPYEGLRVHLLFSGNACENVLKAQEAYSIDVKVDDGKPLAGSVYSNCVDGSAYALNDGSVQCTMAFLTHY